MTEFISRHIGITETEQTQMLEDLGLSSLDELVRQIVPDSILLRVITNYQMDVVKMRHWLNLKK